MKDLLEKFHNECHERGNMYMDKDVNIGDWLRFSIDDVSNAFLYILKNKPLSVFEVPFFALLKKWHSAYGIECCIYLKDIVSEYEIINLDLGYWEELKKETWMHFGWAGYRQEKVDRASKEMSFLRIKEAICTKHSKSAWSATVRLNGDDIGLDDIEWLEEKGIGTFYLSMSDVTEDRFDCREKEKLKEVGRAKRGNKIFLLTDLCLDRLSDGISPDAMANMAEMLLAEFYKKYLQCKMIIHCTEKTIENSSDKIERFWEIFGNIRQMLYVDEMAVIGKETYFTAINSQYLFRCDLSIENADPIVDLQCGYRGPNKKYCSMIVVDNLIWMIPMYEEAIAVYHISERFVEKIDVPFDFGGRKGNVLKYRRALLQGKYIWLLPARAYAIMRLNTEDRTFHILNEWPDDIEFEGLSREDSFVSMSIDDSKLYLFRGQSNKNIVVDTALCRMRQWDIPVEKRFGMVADGKLYLAPWQKYDELMISSYDNEKEYAGETFKIEFPDDIWTEIELYAFWYMFVLNNKIYFLPHEAKAIIVLDTLTGELKTVPVGMENYRSGARIQKGYTGYDVKEYGKNVLIVPYMGNKVILLDDQHNILQTFIFYVPLRKVGHSCVWKSKKKIYREASFPFGLNNFLSRLLNNNVYEAKELDVSNLSQGSGSLSVGQAIIEEVKRSVKADGGI